MVKVIRDCWVKGVLDLDCAECNSTHIIGSDSQTLTLTRFLMQMLNVMVTTGLTVILLMGLSTTGCPSAFCLPLNCFPAAKRKIGRSILFFFFNLFLPRHAYDRKNCSVFICILPPSYTFKTYKTRLFNL